MSYTPTNWQNGDTITAEKLNNLENGVASGALIVDIYGDELTKTVQEINDALVAGTPVYVRWTYGSITDLNAFMGNQWLIPIITVYRYGVDVYRVIGIRGNNIYSDYNKMGLQVLTFNASSITAYPQFANFENLAKM